MRPPTLRNHTSTKLRRKPGDKIRAVPKDYYLSCAIIYKKVLK